MLEYILKLNKKNVYFIRQQNQLPNLNDPLGTGAMNMPSP